ncbi:hypothetical protein AGMMS50293_26730 [Spirochaetia bacterium]|nr:hypothetical protein AGMMS50293_26730 [Spirochaetia bacterium]
MKAATRTPKLDLLELLKEVVEIERETGLCAAFFKAAETQLAVLCEALTLTPSQTALFAVFLNESGGLAQTALAEALKCGRIESMRYYPDIKCLLRRRFIVQKDERYTDTRTWAVPFKMIEALSAGKVPRPASVKNLTLEKFFEVLDRLYACTAHGEKADPRRFAKLVSLNMRLGVCKRAAAFAPEDIYILLYFCRELVVNGTSRINAEQLRRFMKYTRPLSALKAAGTMRNGKHPLMESGLIEISGGGVLDDASLEYSLSSKAKDELLAGIEIYENDAETKKNFVKAKDIPARPLFYNDRENAQISELTELCKSGPFNKIRSRLTALNSSPGLACLFYGDPGTGKTATAYAIARAADRDIVEVNIAETKSMWFGKSEKLIKAVFDDYRQTVERRLMRGENEPVLLFNEADAIFSKRRNIGEDHSGPAQTENAMQNIILEEIEKLSGLLIATTNLTGNLDKAFERRFLYKIEFKKPDPAVRALIWMTHISDISHETAEVLAHTYDFSGGQIGNVARKSSIQFILHGKKPAFELLKRFCDEELLDTGRKPIGFAM